MLNTNIEKIWNYIKKTHLEKIKSGELENNRKKQNFFWLKKEIENEFKEFLEKKKTILKKELDILEENPPKNAKKIATEIVSQIITKDF